jgi:hypothetical protein
VKAEDPSACVTVNCKLWKSTIVLYLNAIKRTCNQGANKSNHPNQHPLFSSRVPTYIWQYTYIMACLLGNATNFLDFLLDLVDIRQEELQFIITLLMLL